MSRSSAGPLFDPVLPEAPLASAVVKKLSTECILHFNLAINMNTKIGLGLFD